MIHHHHYLIHVGIFVFRTSYLLEHYQQQNTPLQLLEDIEWLKIIEQGFHINTLVVDHCERGIDTQEDYQSLLEKFSEEST